MDAISSLITDQRAEHEYICEYGHPQLSIFWRPCSQPSVYLGVPVVVYLYTILRFGICSGSLMHESDMLYLATPPLMA